MTHGIAMPVKTHGRMYESMKMLEGDPVADAAIRMPRPEKVTIFVQKLDVAKCQISRNECPIRNSKFRSTLLTLDIGRAGDGIRHA